MTHTWGLVTYSYLTSTYKEKFCGERRAQKLNSWRERCSRQIEFLWNSAGMISDKDISHTVGRARLWEYLRFSGIPNKLWFLNLLFSFVNYSKSSLFLPIDYCKRIIQTVHQAVSSRATQRQNDAVPVGGIVPISTESKMMPQIFLPLDSRDHSRQFLKLLLRSFWSSGSKSSSSLPAA